MHHELCPDCGHILSQSWTECRFCGGAHPVGYSADKDFDSDLEGDMANVLTDDIGAEDGLWV